MGSNSVGKKSAQYAGKCGWTVARYLLLWICYSIGISLRPAEAKPLALPPSAGLNQVASRPLTYKLVQNGPQSPPTTDLLTNNGRVELNAEKQEFNNNTQVITATGKILVRFNKAILKADKLRVNLKTKIAIAEGNVILIRGQQVLYGSQFEYNFGDDKGKIVSARGDIYQPTLVQDLQNLNVAGKAKTSTPAGERRFPDPVLSDRLRNDQPITSIQNPGTTGVAIGSDRDIENQPTLKPKGTINRFRFQAEKVDFVGDRIAAEKIQLTNDPFSPPELKVEADRAQFRTVNSEEDEITANNARINIENNFKIPIPRDRFVLNKLGKDDGTSNLFNSPVNFGFNGDERGGLYVERNFYPIFNSQLRWTVTPQYFLQRAVTGAGLFDPSVLGVRTNLETNLSPDTTLQVSAALAGLRNSTFRGKASVKQNLNLFSSQHLLTGEATYREEVFNGSLGRQEVQSSIGGVLTSPNIAIGNTGINLDYQVGAQIINANTDRQKLLSPTRSNDLITLSRYQTAANITKSFRFWEGKGLPQNEKSTYNYSPIPVVPYLQINTAINGALSSYSNGDNQSSLGYSIGIQGQFGNFARSSFDYTGFNLSYAQKFRGGDSPFLFDRFVDNRILSGGISQQISGPFRLGIQTSRNLDTGKQFNTDYYLEYSRRTYNVVVRYNPDLQLGSISFRLNDFNWDGTTPKF
jgi:lipopolysaccharide export system protein LptA